MSDLHRHNASATRGMPSPKMTDVSLNQWIHQSIGIGRARVRSQVRGNNLHILVESQPCPDVSVVIPGLTDALAVTHLERMLPLGSPPIYRVMVYGRQMSQKTPAWTESLYLNQPAQPVLSEQDLSAQPQQSSSVVNRQRRSESGRAALETGNTGNIAATSIVPALQLARLGQPEAIARYLSSVFSDLGIAVRARVEAIEQGAGDRGQGTGEGKDTGTRGHGDPQHSASIQNSKFKIQNSSPPPPLPNRLFVVCESAYSPDPLMLADPIAQRLRELELQGFRDAIVFGQVSGEPRREWILQVDLTPTSDILQQWARWGDVQAITRLLNRLLGPAKIWVSAILKDVTLHLTCHSPQSAIPDKLAAIAAIAPTLESLAPQGIQAVTIYGVAGAEAGVRGQEAEGRGQEAEGRREDAGTRGRGDAENSSIQNSKFKTQNSPHTPYWVHWLNLPAKDQSVLALTTLELAHKGSLEAIEFLLTRLLNPDLDWTLATGGIRVQVRKKADLLHVMTDAPTCPTQSQVGPAIARFLQPLQISRLAGIRVYGRRAGQKRPLWSYGVDFVTTRDRLVPEATPDFAASDTYVDELLAPPGALVLYRDLPAHDWRSVLSRGLERAIEKVQRSLISSQLFIPSESEDLNPGLIKSSDTLAEQVNSRNIKVALVWGTVGLLLVVQSEWLLGQVLQPHLPQLVAAAPATPPAASASPPPAISARPAIEPLLPHLALQKSKPTDGAFNPSGFTQPGKTELTEVPAESAPGAEVPTAPANLPASPFQSKADLSAARSANPFPTFNSRQLDEKIALYQRYISEHGPPDVLVIGSSRALRGVDPIALKTSLAAQGYSGVTVYNFGINGATTQVVDLIIRQMLPQEKLPKLILFTDGARAFNSGRTDITYNGIVASEGYRTMVAGRPPIPGTTVAAPVAQAVPPRAPTEPTSVTEAAPTSLANSYQILNQKLNQRLGAVSLAYSYRDRLKSLMRDKLIVLLATGNPLLALGIGITPTDLSDATSPAASALNSASPVLSDGGIVDVDGFLPLPNRFNPVTYYQKYSRVSGDYDSDYDSFSLDGKQTDAMLELVQFTQTHQIPLVFVNLPLTNDYLDPIRKRHEEEFQQHMLRLSTELGFTYRDLGLAFATQTDYFSDPSHLNRYGAYEVSHRLATDVMIPWQKAR